MHESMKLLLSLSASGTFLMFLLFLFPPLYEKRLGYGWQYYIWLIVALRLLLPWTLDLGIHMTLPESRLEHSGISASVPESEPAEVLRIKNEQEKAVLEPARLQFSKQFRKGITFVLQRLHILWFVTALLLLVRRVTVYQAFVKYVEAKSRAVTDIGCLEKLGTLINQHKIRKNVGLYTSSLVSSPLLVGFFHPRIVLPETELSGVDLHYILLHELMHEKRRDILYKWLIQLVMCLHWFNPFVYLMEKKVSGLCELSCDEQVIRNLDTEGKRAYGNTLLNAAGAGNSVKNPAASVSLNESGKLLKGRLEAIMNYRKKSKISKAAAFVLTVVFVLTASAAGVYRTPVKAENKQSSKTQKEDIKIRYENGEYYIFAKGVPESEKPSGGITDGSVGLVLVEKDGYVTLGPYKNLPELLDDAGEQCAEMKKEKYCTGKEMNLLLEGIKEIENAYDASGKAGVMELNKESVVLKKGKQATLKLKGTKKKIAWKSGNQSIASVDQNGKVTAKKAGTAKITAEVGRITFTCKVKVKKTNKDSATDYHEVGIEKKNGAYYYDGRRIRLFMDIRADGSLQLFNYDSRGNYDIQIKRDKKNCILGIWWLPKDEADKIIEDYLE